MLGQCLSTRLYKRSFSGFLATLPTSALSRFPPPPAREICFAAAIGIPPFRLGGFSIPNNQACGRKLSRGESLRRRPPGLSQPSAPCERTDIRAGRGNLTKNKCLCANGTKRNGRTGLQPFSATSGTPLHPSVPGCRAGASRRGTKQIQEPERYCTALARKSSLLSAGIRLRFITRAVAARISVASTMIFTSHSSPMTTPSRTKPSWH